MIIVTTPERLDDLEAANDNTPAAVESATRVPTTGEPIAADADGPDVSAPCTVETERRAVNRPRVTRALTYVSLASGLIVRHLADVMPAPDRYETSTGPALDRLVRVHVLAHDPWQSEARQRAIAETCARTLVAADATRYAPVTVLAAMLETIDALREQLARAETRSAS